MLINMTEKPISEYVKLLSEEGLLIRHDEYEDQLVRGVSYDSRNLGASYIFICKGEHFRKEYLIDAIEKGAAVYVSEIDYNMQMPAVIVNDIRRAMPLLAEKFYGNLSDEMKVIGITGTKGKTTVLYYLKSILDTMGYDIPYTSTEASFDGLEKRPAVNTTEESLELYRYMNNARMTGAPYFLMEVSSQALAFRRTDLIDFEIGAFLNIGYDHISREEHRSFDEYFEAKLKLFSQTRRALVNLDSDFAERILEAAKRCQEIVTISEKDSSANVYAYNLVSENERTEFDVAIQGIDGYDDCGGHIVLDSAGIFNVENAMAAAAMAAMLGISFDAIQKGLSHSRVSGRMSFFYSNDRTRIAVVDFAHNLLSYEALFNTIRDMFPKRRIILCAGAKGHKAVDRRKAIAEYADRYCFRLILTEDDSNYEDTVSICMEVASYLKSCRNYEIIPSRSDAVKAAVSMAAEDNIVLVLGRGAKEFMLRNGTNYIEASDMELVEKEMKEI